MIGKRVIITGATGMVGGCALRLCLDKPEIAGVTVIGRRPVGIEHTKLRDVLHDNFMDYLAVADALEDNDAALYCLGAYTGAVPDEEFRRITVDYTLAFASALVEKSAQAAFCYLSGQGADRTEKSRMAFARYKGMAENGLLEMGFSRVHIFRPGYIYPVTPRREPSIFYAIPRLFYPFVRRIYPNIGVTSEKLAAAMVHAGLYGTGEHDAPLLENRDIRSITVT